MRTTREEWLSLAERIKKATRPDYRIDAAISIALGDVPKGFTAGKTRGFESRFSNKSGDTWDAPRYTASLDDITALIEREFPDSKWAVLRREIGTKAMLDPTPAKDKIAASLTLRQVRTAIYADAETPALALCAVFCRAMAERD
jgi:hypothetical protein